MRRSIILLLLCCIIFSFCSCNEKQENTVKVGIIDSVITDEDISNYNICDILDLVEEDIITNGHGHMVLDIISSNCNNIEIYYVAVLDNSNNATIPQICSAMEYLNNKGVDIINMSFTTLTNDSKLKEAIKHAVESDTKIIAACLNYSDAMCYPACYDGVISVSNILSSGADISFSVAEKKQIAKSVGYNSSSSMLTAYYTSMFITKLQK